MPELTPDKYAEILRKLDEVSRQTEELSRQIRAQMAAQARGEQQLLSNGTSERRRRPRKPQG